jgi:hypothetical protein
VLIAVPLGASLVDQMSQTSYLRNGFINYLLEKRAAGIVNVTVHRNPQNMLPHESVSSPLLFYHLIRNFRTARKATILFFPYANILRVYGKKRTKNEKKVCSVKNEQKVVHTTVRVFLL